MHSRNVEIKSPCHENWDAMHGDDARRYCDVCAKHVHNLSAMSRDEATDLLQEHKGQHLCVRYSSHDDGSIAFRDAPVVPLARLRVARAAFAAAMLAACAPHGDGPPIQDVGDIAIEVMARDARPSADGGCEVQTGPFTTLHFPIDHAVCKQVADRGDAIAPKLPPTPPPVVESMGAVEPLDPPAPPAKMGDVAPVERPTMGEAMPVGVKEPCDPKQGQAVASPPPDLEPEMGNIAAPVEEPPPPSEIRRPLMGDIAAPEKPEPAPRPKMGKIAAPRTGGAVIDDL